MSSASQSVHCVRAWLSIGVVAATLPVLSRAQDPLFAAQATFFGTGAGAHAGPAQVADVDADGLPDVVCAPSWSSPSEAVVGRVLLGTSDGPPSLFHDAPLGPANSVPDARLGDIDGDGLADLVALCKNGAGLRAHLGQGDGSFGSELPSPLAPIQQAFAISLALADMDGDSRLDAIVLHGPVATVAVVKGLGDGTFAGTSDVEIGLAAGGMAGGAGGWRPFVVDFDLDGRLDVVCARTDALRQGELVLLAGTPAGLAAPQVLVSDVVWPIFTVAELDGQPGPDVALATSAGLTIFDNDGAGQLSVRSELAGIEISRLEAGDVDGDGDTDLLAVVVLPFRGNPLLPPEPVFASQRSAGQVLLGDGQGGFATTPQLISMLDSSITLADLGGDGRADLLAAHAQGNTLVAQRALGAGSFEAASRAGPVVVMDVEAADLDGDGDVDLAHAVGVAGVSVSLGQGAGSFGDPATLALDGSTNELRAADLDGDGVPDLAVTVGEVGATMSRIVLLHGLGGGAFAPSGTLSNPGWSYVHDPVLLDADADGLLDIVTIAGEQLVTLRGTGGGAFAAPAVSAAGLGAISLAVGDLDGDGVADAALGGYVGSSQPLGDPDDLFVLHGAGDGSFLAAPALLHDVAFIDVAIGDVDGNGQPDLAGCKGGEYQFGIQNVGTVTVLRGTGGGQFGAAQVLTPGVTAHAVRVADLNGDGFDDLAVAGWVSGNVAILPSLGAGGFAEAQHFVCGFAQGVLPADLNGDGRLDLAVAANGAPVFLNGVRGSFADLGTGTVGTHGIAQLSGVGELLGDDLVTLALGNARPLAAAVLLAGTGVAAQPLAGGLLVPAPSAVLAGLVTDAQGELALSGRWPAGVPSGTHVWFQALLSDPAAAVGTALSTAIVATAP